MLNKEDMSKFVNKKLYPKSYTSTADVLDLKKEMKKSQHIAASIRKCIKYETNALKSVIRKSAIKHKQGVIEHLSKYLEIQEAMISFTAREIQLKRQEAFEGLCNYHPNSIIAKGRMVKEREYSLRQSL